MSQKTEKRARQEAALSQVRIKCVFPPCAQRVLVAAPPDGVGVGTPAHMTTLGGIPMCTNHADMLNFHVWASMNIKLQKQETAGGIIVPGHEQFSPTLTEGIV